MSDVTEQVGVSEIAKKYQRIIYVEPNDVYDKDAGNAQIGETLTPKYEDFCISFNLIIEAFSRFRTSGKSTSNTQTNENGTSKTYQISWGLSRDEMMKRRTSLLQGDKGPFTTDEDGEKHYSVDNYNFLTTYYTDITFDSYKERTQIEGLGVESVQISYESWYTPTVTIKFVDVRGSALWGREEAIHVDEKLTAENIFGAFFTMPYPLFRLQVKGFLGKPVTYQLTCSNFKGNFNTNTGNFEAVATFIGYSWSLLTDIPFPYIVAAPYATYEGHDYWERHKDRPEWALWNGENDTLPPPKLQEMFKNIKRAKDKVKDIHSAASAEQNEKLQQIENERKILNDIVNNIVSFQKSIANNVGNTYLDYYDETDKKEQLLLFYDTNDLKPSTTDTRADYDKLKGSIDAYVNGGFSAKEITSSKYPNGWESCPADLIFIKSFNVATDNTITLLNASKITNDELKNLTFNDGKQLTEKMASELLNVINRKQTKIKNFAYIIDFYDVRTLAKDRLDELKNEEKEIIKQVNNDINENIVNVISSDDNGTNGFKPFIGNVFKIICCHLETFCHIMFKARQEIEEERRNGLRNPSYLGIDMEQTDIISKATSDVTPWPAIIGSGVDGKDCGYKNEEENNIYGWPGDFPEHRFIEEKVVYALQEGIQRLVKNANESGETGEAVKYNAFPISPTDFGINYNPFSASTVGNVSELAGHLATRIASNIGVLCGDNITESLSKEMGKLDAYNLYSAIGSVSDFSNIIKNVDEDLLSGIMSCKEGEKYDSCATISKEGDESYKRHSFEIVKKIKDEYNNKNRHPQFVLKNGKQFYCHFYDQNGINYVPTTLKTFVNYKATEVGAEKGDFVYNADNKDNVYFIPNTYSKSNLILQSNDYIYNCDSSKLSSLTSDHQRSVYINKYMFNIITDSKQIKAINNRKDELEGGGINVFGYEVKDDLSEYINTFIKVGKTHTAPFYKNILHMLSGNDAKLKLDKRRFLPPNTYGQPTTIQYPGAFPNTAISGGQRDDVAITEDGGFTFNGESTTLDDLSIQQFWLRYMDTNVVCSLFGCPFYYMQNGKKSNESDSDSINRILNVKALLFLHTFIYDYKNVTLNVFSSNKKNGAIEEVPKGYLLFLGGLLWRKRYASEHNNVDPIIYTEDGISYKEPGVNYTLFDNTMRMHVYNRDSKTKPYSVTINSLFGGASSIDWNIENQLISLFEDFAKKTYTQILSKYELLDLFNAKSCKYTCKTFKRDVDIAYKYIKNQGKNITYVNDDGKNRPYYADIKNYMVWLRNKGFHGWAGHYSVIQMFNIDPKYQGFMLKFDESDTESQKLFKDLYCGTYIIGDSCYRRMGKSNSSVTTSDTITISNSAISSYLGGFISAANDILENGTVSLGDDNILVSEETYKNRDLSLAIYYYLKNLWDKWLVVADDDEFDVNNFFKKNFIFVDSFYKNVYHLLCINCEKLLNIWNGLVDSGSIFHFMSRICSEHGCIFLPVPDYVGFNGETQQHDIEMMEDLFRPLPYNAMDAPSNNNKFVIMYSHSPSKTCSNGNGYKIDSYDIWSHANYKEGGHITDIAGKLFRSTTNPDFDRLNDNATREGYNVPSFGISFGRQNNHIFKNLSVTMDNPVMTEQSIKSQMLIAQKGSSSAHSICFIGQDTFNVFSNYSYSVTVEMMGNAQICPLMYFQLFNIPMWRGTYMIYKVVHNMTPGNMTTTITGMKMSKFAQPFNSSFLTLLNFFGDDEDTDSLSNNCDDDSGNYPSYDGVYGQSGMFTGKTREEKRKLYHIETDMTSSQVNSAGLIQNVTFNQTGGTKTLPMNKYIAEDFKKICDEILALGWFNLDVANCYRKKNSVSDGISRHCWGIAVDINPGSGGNPWFDKYISQNQTEPKEGDPAPWPIKKTNYGGRYNRNKCIWHWKHPVVQIFLAHGWGWGGAYGDVMHFSVDDGH